MRKIRYWCRAWWRTFTVWASWSDGNFCQALLFGGVGMILCVLGLALIFGVAPEGSVQVMRLIIGALLAFDVVVLLSILHHWRKWYRDNFPQ